MPVNKGIQFILTNTEELSSPRLINNFLRRDIISSFSFPSFNNVLTKKSISLSISVRDLQGQTLPLDDLLHLFLMYLIYLNIRTYPNVTLLILSFFAASFYNTLNMFNQYLC